MDIKLKNIFKFKNSYFVDGSIFNFIEFMDQMIFIENIHVSTVASYLKTLSKIKILSIN